MNLDLDDPDLYRGVDSEGMLSHIDALPDQLADAWEYAQDLALPEVGAIRQVVTCGMGGSSISGELAGALISDVAKVPLFVHRDYDLPPFASGPETLVLALSHSGNTEETLSAARCAIERGTSLLAITTGGSLAPFVQEAGGTVWKYDYSSPPRAALGWLYGLTLAALSRLEIAPDLSPDVEETVALLRRGRKLLGVDSPVGKNAAKRIAGQLVDRIPVIWGAELLAPVARRWKTQLNENAKSSAYFELLPELNHNSIVGIEFPAELMHRIAIVQLLSPRYDHPRVAIRHEVTHDLLLQQGILTEMIKARGESRLAHQMSLIQFGDYVSYYLAVIYDVDPTPIGPITILKEKLAQAG
ncbi:MAG TPA: bifunctional phosphoglucose/phosphomannose isomerase [Chloroflexi bacterium]|nr:bifunctional phosphoglucose/phosphomannose isomerase [Chloroflexota bacterium]